MSSYPVNSNWESWSADRRTYVVSKRARTGEPVSQRNHLIISDNDPCKSSKLSLSHFLAPFRICCFWGDPGIGFKYAAEKALTITVSDGKTGRPSGLFVRRLRQK